MLSIDSSAHSGASDFTGKALLLRVSSACGTIVAPDARSFRFARIRAMTRRFAAKRKG